MRTKTHLKIVIFFLFFLKHHVYFFTVGITVKATMCSHHTNLVFMKSHKKKPQGLYLFTIHFNISYVVFKYSWHIYFWELVFAEHNKEAGFTARTITNNHKFFTNCCHDAVHWKEKKQLLYFSLYKSSKIKQTISKLIFLWGVPYVQRYSFSCGRKLFSVYLQSLF